MMGQRLFCAECARGKGPPQRRASDGKGGEDLKNAIFPRTREGMRRGGRYLKTSYAKKLIHCFHILATFFSKPHFTVTK